MPIKTRNKSAKSSTNNNLDNRRQSGLKKTSIQAQRHMPSVKASKIKSKERCSKETLNNSIKNQKQENQKKQSLDNINQNSISFQISIHYATPQLINEEKPENRFLDIIKKQKQSEKQCSSQINVAFFLQESENIERKQASIIEIINRKQTQDTQQQYLFQNDSNTIKKVQISINSSSKNSIRSMNSIIKRRSELCISKKQQKNNKIKRKAKQIQENGNIQDIAKQIEKLNNKTNLQHEGVSQNMSNLQNSKSIYSQIRNSSSSNNSSSISVRTIFYKRKARSEKMHITSSNSTVRPDTDPIRYRKALMRNSMHYTLRRDYSQFQNQAKLSTISFYDQKQLAIIEQSICEVKNEQISLLEVEDWVKFVCLILKLDKRTFNKIVRLMNRVTQPSDPMEAIFYYAGACISIYAKMQCQHIFHEQQKQFPEIPPHSQHKRLQIQSLHPILQMKQLRRAQCQIADIINFRFQLHDTLMQESLDICQKWNKYIVANQKALKKKPLQFFKIGTEDSHQRRNYLSLTYIMDSIQFIRELMTQFTQNVSNNVKNNSFQDSPTTSTNSIENNESKNVQLILISIFVVISNNFAQKYCSNLNSLTDSMILVSNFSKKMLKIQERKIIHFQGLMKKSKQIQIQKLLSRIQLDQLTKMQNKTKQMKSKQEINNYIHYKSLWFRNVGKIKTHQQLQWFL